MAESVSASLYEGGRHQHRLALVKPTRTRYREAAREAERGSKRQREAERGRERHPRDKERQREAERGRERQREAERGREAESDMPVEPAPIIIKQLVFVRQQMPLFAWEHHQWHRR